MLLVLYMLKATIYGRMYEIKATLRLVMDFEDEIMMF